MAHNVQTMSFMLWKNTTKSQVAGGGICHFSQTFPPPRALLYLVRLLTVAHAADFGGDFPICWITSARLLAIFDTGLNVLISKGAVLFLLLRRPFLISVWDGLSEHAHKSLFTTECGCYAIYYFRTEQVYSSSSKNESRNPPYPLGRIVRCQILHSGRIRREA